MLVVAAAQTGRIQSCKPKPSVAIGTQSNPLCASAGGDGGSGPREHDDLERWCGGRALPWHRADLGIFGAHALSRCPRVARMDSCGPLLATHFLLEKQVEAPLLMCGWPPPGKRSFGVQRRGRLQSCVRPVGAVRVDCWP